MGYPLKVAINPHRNAVCQIKPLVRALVLFVTIITAAMILSGNYARAEESFFDYLESLRPKGHAMGIEDETFDAAFAGMKPNPAVIAATKKQAEFSKPIEAYLDSAVTPDRIEKGKAKMREYHSWLKKAEEEYGVDPGFVLAVWAMETNFGANPGNLSTIRSLASLAYIHFRGNFFENELLDALLIVQNQNFTPSHLTGSWAGAMGQTQFMPSSYLKYAVDFDGSGNKDIWNNAPDAIGSTANYLKEHGWIVGETWGYEVKLPKTFNPANFSPAEYFSFSRFSQEGVKRVDGEALPSQGEGALLMPTGIGGPIFLATPNFKVIKSYNNSTAYALAVAILADQISGYGGLRTPWPQHQPRLSPAQAVELQKRLHKVGYDVGELDGKLGEKATIAILAYQKNNGLPIDGTPTMQLLKTLRSSDR